MAFGVATAGLSSAFDVRCSIAVRATVLTALHPTGPIGTSAEFSAVLSETTVAVAFSIEGACWAAGRLFTRGRGWPAVRAGLRLGPKRVVFYDGSTDA